MKKLSKAEFKDWLEMQIYVSGRDWVGPTYQTFTEVYEKLYGEKPDYKEIEAKILEGSMQRVAKL